MAEPNPSQGWGARATGEPAATQGWAAQATLSRPQQAATSTYPTAVRERSARLLVRKISPWSVLKVSFLVYFCLEIVAVLVFTVAWTVLTRLGTFTTVQSFAAKLSVHVRFPAFAIFKWYILGGLGTVVLLTLATVLLTLLVNLVADITGGVELTLSERVGRVR